MTMSSPASPPVHRLPVLTEVILLDDDTPFGSAGDAAIASFDASSAGNGFLPSRVEVPAPAPGFAPDPQGFAAAPSAYAADADDFPGALDPQPPQWLRRRPSDDAGRVALPLPAVAPPSPLPPDFTGSWWTRDDGHVPDEVRRPPAPPLVRQIVAPVQPAVSETELVRRVMRDLDGQIDMMFDHRMREVIAPALARAADALMSDLRERLAVTVRDMVVRAVTVEVSRLQRGEDSR